MISILNKNRDIYSFQNRLIVFCAFLIDLERRVKVKAHVKPLRLPPHSWGRASPSGLDGFFEELFAERSCR